jgi:hypothetical protein
MTIIVLAIIIAAYALRRFVIIKRIGPNSKAGRILRDCASDRVFSHDELERIEGVRANRKQHKTPRSHQTI